MRRPLTRCRCCRLKKALGPESNVTPPSTTLPILEKESTSDANGETLSQRGAGPSWCRMLLDLPSQQPHSMHRYSLMYCRRCMQRWQGQEHHHTTLQLQPMPAHLTSLPLFLCPRITRAEAMAGQNKNLLKNTTKKAYENLRQALPPKTVYCL